MVLCGLLFFTGCEEDNISYDQPKQFGPKHGEPASYLEGEEAERAKMLLNSVIDRSMSRSWTVDFSEVLMITDTIGNKNYTFRVVHPNSVPKEFYNLVLTENSRTGYSTVKLVRYVMSQNFADRFYSGISNGTEFAGTITFTPVGDKQSVLPIVQPGEDPIPSPEPEPDPCEDEIVIEVPDNPGGGGGYVGGGSGGGSTGGGGNGSPVLDQDLSWTDCFQWLQIPCSKGNEHYGNSAECNASFPGATYLINTCNIYMDVI
jgi:hypothetical protein